MELDEGQPGFSTELSESGKAAKFTTRSESAL
jgi:hypothetical protein